MLVERNDIIKKMRDMGFLYQDIGDLFGVSRQRAEQLVKPVRTAEARRRYRKACRDRAKGVK